jgi:hypothetical protein
MVGFDLVGKVAEDRIGDNLLPLLLVLFRVSLGGGHGVWDQSWGRQWG